MQGIPLKIPSIDKKYLDLYSLHKVCIIFIMHVFVRLIRSAHVDLIQSWCVVHDIILIYLDYCMPDANAGYYKLHILIAL